MSIVIEEDGSCRGHSPAVLTTPIPPWGTLPLRAEESPTQPNPPHASHSPIGDFGAFQYGSNSFLLKRAAGSQSDNRWRLFFGLAQKCNHDEKGALNNPETIRNEQSLF